MAWTDAARAASAAVRRAHKQTRVVYHGTSWHNARAIAKRGFHPVGRKLNYVFNSQRNANYFSDRLTAKGYAQMGRKRGSGAVIKVRIPTHKLHEIKSPYSVTYFAHGISAKRIRAITRI